RALKGDHQISHNGQLIMASKLPEPIFDPTTKSDVKDEPITMDQILDEGWLSQEQLEELKKKSLHVYLKISERADKAGFILADLKLEFGFNKEEEIILADSIGPDEFRLWPKDQYKPGRSQESYDKQPVRDWLSKVGYKKTLDKARSEGLPVPHPPTLPPDLVQETSRRYIEAYERLTGKKL
ncbi:MAG TPA: phosphoribosylaminoimidazolesuccinocarboxamide synthase, partial [Candidatus Binatus sp.]|nr:phosphoribosylaminoimidazolesuccinocarboxamide synthase [Candidatus Binatus sp.]